jgi:hypothetical protein
MNTRVLLIPAGALLLAGLSGCALPMGSGSAADARDRMYDVLGSTEDQLGGQWDDQDDPTARGCSFPIWASGSHYPALRVGSRPTNARSAIESVSKLWKKLGYALESHTVGSVTELKGTASLDRLLVLRVSADAMTLQGESECRPD